MTNAVSMLLNLITLAESGDTSFKLEVSRTYHDVEDFVPRKMVYDGQEVTVVELADLMEASKDWPVLRHEVIEKYIPELRLVIPAFETE